MKIVDQGLSIHIAPGKTQCADVCRMGGFQARDNYGLKCASSTERGIYFIYKEKCKHFIF